MQIFFDLKSEIKRNKELFQNFYKSPFKSDFTPISLVTSFCASQPMISFFCAPHQIKPPFWPYLRGRIIQVPTVQFLPYMQYNEFNRTGRNRHPVLLTAFSLNKNIFLPFSKNENFAKMTKISLFQQKCIIFEIIFNI